MFGLEALSEAFKGDSDEQEEKRPPGRKRSNPPNGLPKWERKDKVVYAKDKYGIWFVHSGPNRAERRRQAAVKRKRVQTKN